MQKANSRGLHSFTTQADLQYETRSSLCRRMSPQCFFGVFAPVYLSGLDLRRAQVVAIATGTKCLNGEYISDQGLVVNDCHAEIVARRAFLRFLYSQLELLLR